MATFFSAADTALIYAIRDMWEADLNLTALRVEALSARRIAESSELSKTYDSARNALAKRHRGAQYEEELAKIATEFSKQQRVKLEQALKDYTTIENELVDNLKARAGDAWIFEDYNHRRLRKETAKAFRSAIYKNFCFRLEDRDPESVARIVGQRVAAPSVLDRFANRPGSLDRLNVQMVGFADSPKPPSGVDDGTPALGNSLWRMHHVLAAHPVESLRKHDKDVPKIAGGGTELESMFKILHLRLERFYELQNEEQRLYGEVQRLSKHEPPELPDTHGLIEAFDAVWKATKGFEGAIKANNDAREAYNKAAKAFGDASAAYQEAVDRLLLVDKNGIRIARPDERHDGESPDALRKRFDAKIKNLEANVKSDPALAQRIDEFRKQRASIDQTVETVLKSTRDAMAAAEKARNEAQVAYKATGVNPEVYRQKPAEQEEEYKKVKRRHDSAVKALSDQLSDLPSLPEKLSDLAPEKYRTAVEQLDKGIVAVRNKFESSRREMAARLGELERNELEFAEVAGVVANHRNAAAILAETTMKRLSGNKIDDELAAELNKLKVATDQGNKFLSNTKSRAERLGDILKYLTDDKNTKDAQKLIANFVERVDNVAKGTKIANQAIETVKILEELKTQLETKNLETVAQSMATLLDVSGKVAGKVPVLGPTIGQFIGFYSKAAGASAQAAVKIQGKIIEFQNWNAFPRPDRHFYTLDEVKTEVNTGDPVKIMEMLQVRRILALVHADSWADAQEMTLQRAAEGRSR